MTWTRKLFERAVRWLTETKTDDDPQTIALRLVLLKKQARPTEECKTFVRRIKESQNEDEGWSQSNDITSEAWTKTISKPDSDYWRGERVGCSRVSMQYGSDGSGYDAGPMTSSHKFTAMLDVSVARGTAGQGVLKLKFLRRGAMHSVVRPCGAAP